MQTSTPSLALLPPASQRPTRSLRARGRTTRTPSAPAPTVSEPAPPAAELTLAPNATVDTRQGITCMSGGLVGIGLGLGGLYSSPAAAAQIAALGVVVVSLLVCEFAFNALWDPKRA